MSLRTLKLELVKQILEIESQSILTKLFATLKKEDEDFWISLTAEQKVEVELGIRQIENGETENWDDFLKRVS